MRSIALLCCLFLSSAAGADEIYVSVAAYLDAATKSYPRDHTSSWTSQFSQSKDGISRVFGFVRVPAEEIRVTNGFIFVLDRVANGYRVEVQSEAFEMRDFLGVNEVAADTNTRFHIGVLAGRMSVPTADTYRFGLVKGEWRVTGHDRSTSERCSDGSIGSGDSFSANFLTGDVKYRHMIDCGEAGRSHKKKLFPPIPLSHFLSLDLWVQSP